LRESGHFEVKAPCTFLVERDGKARCSLVLAELAAIEHGDVEEGLISRTLAIGWGCTMDDEEEGKAA
jgi:hypothetical protein